MADVTTGPTLLTNATLVAGLNLPASILEGLKSNDREVYEKTSNEFLTALINKIAAQRVEAMERYSNPFKQYDGAPVAYGDTIENVGIGYIQGEVYDKNATDPYEIKTPTEIKTQYCSVNYKMVYPVTTYEQSLRHAVLSETGLMNILDSIVEMLDTSKSMDEYQAQVAFLNNPDIYAEGIKQLTYPKGASAATIGKSYSDIIFRVSHDFKFPSSQNNAMGFKMQHSTINNLMICMKQDIKDSIDLDYLAGVFNLTKVQLEAKIETVRDFRVTSVDESNHPISKGADIDFIIFDTRGFDNHVNLEVTTSIYNPRNLAFNTFVHFWKIFGFKKWHNAKAYKFTEALQ